jgi:hypothetical protein
MRLLTDETAVAALVVIGLVQLAVHPRKTYDLVVHKKGWYD